MGTTKKKPKKRKKKKKKRGEKKNQCLWESPLESGHWNLNTGERGTTETTREEVKKKKNRKHNKGKPNVIKEY